ncbi:serine/arginine repetitive matrix protein 5-like [Anastrepha ludens]|uniref:serine/arginine repetitive matrix protein 5-like n=1 Tax=Anastrepha ludens TaxID=28586 RepID=UPI0023B197B6|nr:serine/arginine repetitive matrix protein 5-like [Anastrepha ludens]
MSLDEREQEEEIMMIEPEECCSHEPAPDTSRKNVDERKLLEKAIKKAFKAQKLLNQAIERLEAGQKQKRKYKQHKRRASSSSSSNSSSSSGTSSSSSSSSSSDSDVDEPPKRRHGRKHHHGRRHRHGRDRSRSRGHSRGHSRGRSRDHSRGHSRGRSRGHSRGHSHGRSRDHQLCQATRFFRGASLPTAPPIQKCHPHHHQRSHTRPETTHSAHLDRKPRSRSGSRSHSRERHDKRGHKKHHKNKKHKKVEKREETRHSGKDKHSKRGRSHSRDRSHSRSHSRGCRHGMHGFVYNEGVMGRPTRGYPYFGAFSDRPHPHPPPPPPPPYVQQGRDGHHSHRDHPRCGYPHGPVDDFNWQWMPPIYYGEERGRRHRAHSVPGC